MTVSDPARVRSMRPSIRLDGTRPANPPTMRVARSGTRATASATPARWIEGGGPALPMRSCIQDTIAAPQMSKICYIQF